jgi:hypothetical protein
MVHSRAVSALSRYSEWEAFSLLQREEVVSVKINKGPHDDNYEESNEAGIIVHYWGEGKYYR